MVKKKNGDYRFSVDYRELNNITFKDPYPLQRMDDVVHILGKAKYFFVIDLANGYWQIPVAERDKPKSAFVTFNGYEFN